MPQAFSRSFKKDTSGIPYFNVAKVIPPIVTHKTA